MKTSAKKILTVMHVLTWIAFIGYCIKSGGILFSYFLSLYVNPATAGSLNLELNLSELYKYSIFHYSNMVMLVALLSAMKAFIAYLAIKIFLKINLVHPFSHDIASLITRIGYVAFGLGILAIGTEMYAEWFIEKGMTLKNLLEYIGDSNEFLFLGGIVFIIAQVFNRGIEIQSEHELTV